MGCGSSKSATTLEADSNNGITKTKKDKTSFKNDTPNGDLEKNMKNRENVPAPVTFEIPVIDEDSIIKKHPPKRLQKLEDQEINVTEDKLLEKQIEAKERRQKLLQERISSSRLSANRSSRRMQPKKSTILEQIEHEKTNGSPTRKTSDTIDF